MCIIIVCIHVVCVYTLIRILHIISLSLVSCPDGSGWCGSECASADDGLLAHSVHHCAVRGAARGSGNLRRLPQVLSAAVQRTAAHTADTHGQTASLSNGAC